MISKFEEIQLLFKEINARLNKKIFSVIIGGAALLHHGVGKGYTKDIDLVFENEAQFYEFRDVLVKLGFIAKARPISHEKLEIFEMLEKQEFRFDLFVNTVCNGFCLSKNMIERAKTAIEFDKMTIKICSKEDIVLFKSLSPGRQNDIEDSVDLIKRGIDWNIIYDELVHQTNICKDTKKKKEQVYYFIERMADLEERDIKIPISNKITKFYNSLE